jgi:sugar (pentulose or hexulose) kinase
LETVMDMRILAAIVVAFATFIGSAAWSKILADASGLSIDRGYWPGALAAATLGAVLMAAIAWSAADQLFAQGLL